VLHPDKTRFVDFRSHRPDGKDHPDSDGTTFTFLGFCVLQRHKERRAA
jgi:RNA-directed DNA polymerase